MQKLLIPGILMSLIFTSCAPEKETLTEYRLKKGENVYYFYWTVQGTSEELKAEEVKNLEGKTTNDVLTNVLLRLTEHFNKNNSGERLEFELKDLTIIEADSVRYPIAVVNIKDPANIMKNRYFQGSTGGMHSQTTIMYNLLQPQIEHFIDGVIIHINNKPVGEMDHVNLTGIIAPGGMSYRVSQAILQNRN